MAAAFVAPVGAQPLIPRAAGHVGSRRGVVERQDRAPVEQAEGTVDPCGGFVLQRDPGSFDGLGKAPKVDRLPHHLDEVVTTDTDPDLVPGAVACFEQAEGQVVEQLVGHDHAGERPVRQVGRRLDSGWVVGAQSVGPLEGHIAPAGQARWCSGQHGAGQGAVPRARLDHGEAVGPAQPLPRPVHPTSQHGTEQRPHLGARDEVAPTAGGPARCIEASGFVVEAGVDVLVEAERALPAEPRRQPVGGTGDVSSRGPAG